MNISEQSLERKLQKEFFIPLRVVVSKGPIDVNRLAPKELARLKELPSCARQDSWLRGRAALKPLLARLGEDDDTSTVIFPNARFSLTHSGEYAIAVGADISSLVGVGVDLEIDRKPRLESAPFFLSREEQRWCMGLEKSVRSQHLLRLWTVKEALFKSYPYNQETSLLDYKFEDPGKRKGKAFVPAGEGWEMLYCSFPLNFGILSVAIFPKRRRHDDA